jgi:hypothetical protein
MLEIGNGDITGAELFELVAKRLCIPAGDWWCFALKYADDWVSFKKKLTIDQLRSQQPFYFLIKYFPFDIGTMHWSEDSCITAQLLYRQVRRAIDTGEIDCDDVDIRRKLDIIATKIDNDTRGQYSIVSNIVKYLQIAEQLEMYGAYYFDVIEKRSNCELCLAVHAFGLRLHDRGNRKIAKFSSKWDEIKQISFIHHKLIIDFMAKNLQTNKQIVKLCMGYHEISMRRSFVQRLANISGAPRF